MASPEDVSDLYRPLARRIDAETLEHLGAAELKVRVETAHGLYAEADRADNGYQRHSLTREAERTLGAVSLRAFILAVGHLSDQIDAARIRGDDRAFRERSKELDRFAKDNPQPGLNDPAVVMELMGTEAKKPRKFRLWRSK